MWQDIQTLMELVSDDPGAEDALMAEAAATLERLQAVLDEWELGSMLNGRFDSNGCVLSIQAGAGGVGGGSSARGRGGECLHDGARYPSDRIPA